MMVMPSPSKKWEFSLTPYGWATSINGDITARGHTADINESFIEVVEKSDSSLAWMTYFEAVRGASRSSRTSFGQIGFPVASTLPKVRLAGSTEHL